MQHGGFYMIDNSLLRQYGRSIRPTGIAIYNVLAMHANRERQAWPSYSRIAHLLGIGRGTVVRNIRALERLGVITVQRRTSDDGDALSNLYFLPPLAHRTAPRGANPEPEVVRCEAMGGAMMGMEQYPIELEEEEEEAASASASPTALGQAGAPADDAYLQAVADEWGDVPGTARRFLRDWVGRVSLNEWTYALRECVRHNRTDGFGYAAAILERLAKEETVETPGEWVVTGAELYE